MPCTLLKTLWLCRIWWPLLGACTIRSNSQDICSLSLRGDLLLPSFSPSYLCQPSDSWESHSVIQRNLKLPGRKSHRLQLRWPVPSEWTGGLPSVSGRKQACLSASVLVPASHLLKVIVAPLIPPLPSTDTQLSSSFLCLSGSPPFLNCNSLIQFLKSW